MAKKSNKIINYFKDVKSEVKKVVWPDFKQIKNNTLIVIACILIVGAFIWVADGIFDVSLGRIVKRAQLEETAKNQASDTNSASSEDTLAAMQSYLKTFGITYDGEKYYDKSGKELTQDQVTEIISKAASESGSSDSSKEGK